MVRGNWINNNILWLCVTGPCENHQWLVLGDDNVPQCKERDCPDKQIMFKNQCVLIDQLNTTMCRPGMRIIATETGQGDCDCQRGHVYWNNLTRGEQVSYLNQKQKSQI